MSCRNVSGASIGGSFQLPIIRTLTSSGTYTSTPGTQYCEVYVIAGGGGGGGGIGGTSGSGGGGGAGGVEMGFYPAGTYSVVVGAAGLGGNSGVTGTSGSNSTFDGTLLAVGGNGGQGGAAASNVAGGLGGTPQSTYLCRESGHPPASAEGGIIFFKKEVTVAAITLRLEAEQRILDRVTLLE
jgi:hypothetical protein